MNVLYPDLGVSPKDWTGGRLGAAIRLVPPGAYLDRARAAIVVSPLIPRSRQLPEPALLIQQAIAAECARTSSEVLLQHEAVPVQTTDGLDGVRLDLKLRRGGDGKTEQRVYVMFQDETWLYGINYVADEETFPVFAELFDTVARSLKAHPAI